MANTNGMWGAGGQAPNEEPLDTRELRDESLRYLRDVVRSKPDGRQLGAGVSAAGRILAHCEWREEHGGRPRETLLRIMNGDPDAYAAFLRAELAHIEAKRQGAA